MTDSSASSGWAELLGAAGADGARVACRPAGRARAKCRRSAGARRLSPAPPPRASRVVLLLPLPAMLPPSRTPGMANWRGPPLRRRRNSMS